MTTSKNILTNRRQYSVRLLSCQQVGHWEIKPTQAQDTAGVGGGEVLSVARAATNLNGLRTLRDGTKKNTS